MEPKSKIGYIKYNKDHKAFSRELRNNSTLGEILLWKQMRAGRMLRHKFNRQKPLGKYVVDFYCKKLNLVIELDGYSHQFKAKEDSEREKELIKMELSVLRFTEQECRKQIFNVVRAIEIWIEENQSPVPFRSSANLEKTNTNPPNPLYKGEKANGQ